VLNIISTAVVYLVFVIETLPTDSSSRPWP